MSHPAWVCGLKRDERGMQQQTAEVTPCVGVWIETYGVKYPSPPQQSHPAWVCGLKPAAFAKMFNSLSCHTLRGCVD